MSETFDIAYAAHTASCTFLLDQEGVCRRVVMNAPANGRRRDDAKTASRCTGAQYVASLDPRASGSLVELPRVGASMLFARVDARGRVSLVRTGVVTRFESKRAPSREPTHDPFAQTDGVRTSAPDVALTPRSPGSARPSRPPPTFERPPASEEAAPARPRDPVYFDGSDRTQRLNAVRPAALHPHGEEDIDVDDLATAEYPSAPDVVGSQTPAPSTPPPLPTLRRQVGVPGAAEADIHSAKTLTRRSEPPRTPGRIESSGTAARAVRPDEAPRSGLELSAHRRR